eukprot:CAMPEP_0170197004 /NCGR_PEP_ID=MMETSP0040_2-20121228/65344_1 /TAXON_ID=641309 /ORGANISM="Lotharella oceanica, Strain CCMP622" /LENGTH=102 /DNA_ID=CAMNT_0010446591 /DNA_START=677 /DNA_END=985 /DNA_ORIENTATION=-
MSIICAALVVSTSERSVPSRALPPIIQLKGRERPLKVKLKKYFSSRALATPSATNTTDVISHAIPTGHLAPVAYVALEAPTNMINAVPCVCISILFERGNSR